MKKMRAKFNCESVTKYQTSARVELRAVMADENEENQDFNRYTPAGDLSMMIDNPSAIDYFQPGKEYYLDFTEVEEGVN